MVVIKESATINLVLRLFGLAATASLGSHEYSNKSRKISVVVSFADFIIVGIK